MLKPRNHGEGFPSFLRLAQLLAIGTVVLFGGPAWADTFVVTKTEEARDGTCDADCSLREAVIDANANPGMDTILLPPGTYFISFAGFEDGALLGDLDLLDDVEILGSGADVTVIDVDRDSAFQVHPGVTALISDLTLSPCDGGVFENSGCINSQGELTLLRCQIFNSDSAFGAAVRARAGSLTIDTCTMADNVSSDSGGTISTAVVTTITNSTISGGIAEAGDGGGIHAVSGADVTVNNSTITGNSASLSGGGIQVHPAATLEISNSVIAGNTNSGVASPDCSGTVISAGFNLIGDDSGCTGFSGLVNDQVGTAGSPLDPLLLPLANYGGMLKTHLPATGSPLIDQGSDGPSAPTAGGCEVVDARGAARPFDGDSSGTAVCDIGAVEAGALFLFADGFESGDAGAWDGVVTP